MPLQTRFLFSASMDVDPEREALFHRLYEEEHIPALLEVPGVLSAARLRVRPLEMVIEGERRTIEARGEPRYTAVYEIEGPHVLTSDAWARAVDRGRWPREVRPYTRNRRFLLWEVIFTKP